MPEQTNEDVVSGFIGLTVVLARRNEMIPARLKPPPIRAIVAAAAARMNADTSSNGAIKELPHIAPASSTATAGGGILSSSASMRMNMKQDAELCRAATVTPANGALSFGVGTNDVSCLAFAFVQPHIV